MAPKGNLLSHPSSTLDTFAEIVFLPYATIRAIVKIQRRGPSYSFNMNVAGSNVPANYFFSFFFFFSLFVAVLVDNFQRTITAVEVKPHKKHSGVQFKSVFDEVRYRLRSSFFRFLSRRSKGRSHEIMG